MSFAERPPLPRDIVMRALGARDELAWPLSAGDWEELIAQAREAQLLGALAHRLRERNLLDDVPAAPRAHLVSGSLVAAAQHAVVRRELREIAGALSGIGGRVVLLKGAAYLAAGLPCAPGRMFSDIDLLVSKRDLPHVEAALMLAGFATTHLDPYDQRYYRRMHELPPMQHIRRGTVIDVHHAIVPHSSGIRLDGSKLLDAAIPLADGARFFTLAPADMVLHSATHLFNNEDMTHALRDLVDLDVLLRHFGRDASFWPSLAVRADALDLRRPFHYALRWTSRLLRTPVPETIADAGRASAPAFPVSLLMDRPLAHALRPSARHAATRIARQLLFVRGHWLKMPVPMLAWHLTVKTFRREERPA